MNNIQKLDKILDSYRIKISRDEMWNNGICENVDAFNIDMLIFFKHDNEYGWGYLTEDGNFEDLDWNGMKENIKDHLNDKDIEYFLKNPDLYEKNP